MEDIRINPGSPIFNSPTLAYSLLTYNNSIRTLSRLKKGEDIFYVPETGAFVTKKIFAYPYEPTENLFGENPKAVVKAFDDFSEKLKKLSEEIERIAAEKIFTWKQWNEIKIHMGNIDHSINGLDACKNLEKFERPNANPRDTEEIQASLERLKNILSGDINAMSKPYCGFKNSFLIDELEIRFSKIVEELLSKTSIYINNTLIENAKFILRPLLNMNVSLMEMNQIFSENAIKKLHTILFSIEGILSTGYDFVLPYIKNDYAKVLEIANSVPELFFLAMTSFEEGGFIEKYRPTEFPEGIWNNYIVHRDDWAGFYNNADQRQYGNMLHEGVLIGVGALKENRWDFYQLLNFLAFHRFQVSMRLKKHFKDELTTYGVLRCSNSQTPLENSYKGLGDRLNVLKEKWKDEKNEHFEEDHTIATINEQKIVLSTILLNKIWHTPFEHFHLILKHVSSIYEKCLQEEKANILLENLGRIFWWICKVKPWVSGDPSIAEMLIKVIWRYLTGKDLPPWIKGVAPWERVEEQPDVEKFAKDFYTLFETSPI